MTVYYVITCNVTNTSINECISGGVAHTVTMCDMGKLVGWEIVSTTRETIRLLNPLSLSPEKTKKRHNTCTHRKRDDDDNDQRHCRWQW